MPERLSYPPELLLKAQGVVVIFLDVDGVLTDGGLYLSARGETLKRFHVLDGYGLKMLQAAGMVPVVITGRDSKPLRARLQSLGIALAWWTSVPRPEQCWPNWVTAGLTRL
jgi:3-deoxy-D-manno-octulosonate 8-phosphate phosphatase (KDO 8-P phosphatase)